MMPGQHHLIRSHTAKFKNGISSENYYMMYLPSLFHYLTTYYKLHIFNWLELTSLNHEVLATLQKYSLTMIIGFGFH